MPCKLLMVFISMAFFFGWTPSPLCAQFTDSLGRKITLETPPQRVISLAPSLTEILYFLGLGDRVVGVTKFSYYPPEAAKKPKVGSYVNLNVERIISLSPDLVFGTVDGNEPGVMDLLEQAGIAIYLVNPRSLRQVMEAVSAIGLVCGIPKKARSLSMKLTRRVDRIVEKTRSLKKTLVFLQINVKPIMSVNKETFHHDLIRLSGGRNMTRDAPIPYPRISLEEVIGRKPEVILISSMERGREFEKARLEWLKWTFLPAVKNKRVHVIDSDLIDRPSPRIVRGLEIMAKLIHPEVKWE